MEVITYFKSNNHVKLKGKAYQNLKKAVFDRDCWMCKECGTNHMLTLSHIIHRGMGGSRGPGDVIDNCQCLCMACHDQEERHLNGKTKK